MNFDDPTRMPQICYIIEHESIKNNIILSLVNKIQNVIEERLSKDPLHDVNDLIYCIEMIEEINND